VRVRIAVIWAFGIGCGAGVAGCAAGLRGTWDATGEVEEGRFFAFRLDCEDPEKPVADFGPMGGERVRLAVCALTEKDGRVEFRMDPDSRATTCEAMKSPYRFVGEFGRDVLTGRVLDSQGRDIGMFRAFRTGS